jgi:mannose-6-phosphate isomerase-like protein (cupin superfamily)
MMTLQPGGSTGERVENEHPNAEQWLFVVSGTGRAMVGKRTLKIVERSLLLIEKGEPHKITNTGRSPLVTLNFYIPPAYTKAGDVRLSATNANLLRTIARPFTR